jgi:hypothetical protein
MGNARKKKLPPLLFSQSGILPDATLTFCGDPAITCVVVADRKVNFEGQVDFPSAAARKVRKRLGYHGSEASGRVQWKYDGEALGDRRSRLEGRDRD